MGKVNAFPLPPLQLPADHDPSLDFRCLKQLVSIGEVLADYGLTERLRNGDDVLVGPCPLHGGDNPTAFRVQPDRGLWHCWTRCGGGDVVELVRRIEDCSYAQAARHLRRIALVDDDHASDILREIEAKRNRIKPFRPFRRRISLDPKVPFLQQQKGITVPTAVYFEAGAAPLSVFLEGTVAVRLHDLAGRPVGYCGRRLDNDEIAQWGKWRFPPGLPKGELLFNAHRFRPDSAPAIVVVESPWSVMRLAQAGVGSVVALLGTQLSHVQAEWLARANSLFLLLDGDPAGRLGARQVASELESKTEVTVHELPNGVEPEDLSDGELSALAKSSLPLS